MNAPTGPMNPYGGEPDIYAAIVPRKFWLKYKPVMEYVDIGGKTIAKDTGKLRAEEWVEWDKKLTGSQTIPVSCVNAVDRIKKGAERSSDPNDEAAAIWRTMRPFYDNWKAGGDASAVVTGTPLAVWAGVTADVVELLKPFRIYSVEDLSMIGDQMMQKLPHPNMAAFRERAKKFLATKDIAIAVRELDESKQEMAAMREQIAMLQKAHADAAKGRKEAEEELDEATPAVARKKRAKEAA